MAALGIRIGGRLVGYVFALIVARIAGPDAWGQFSLSLAVISLGSILAVTGFDTAMVKVAAGLGRAIQRLLPRVATITFAQSALVAVMVWLLAPTIAVRVFGDPGLEVAFQWAALAVIPISLQQLLAKTLNGLAHVSVSVLYQQVLRFVVPMFVLLGMTWADISTGRFATDIVLSYAIGNAVLILPIMWSVRSAVSVGEEKSGSSFSIYQLYGLAIPLLLANSMGFVKGWADTILVGVYLSDAEVGLYDIAFRLGTAISLPLWGASAIASPLIARSAAENDRHGIEESARSAASLAAGLATPVAAVMLLFPELFLGLFGPEFIAAAPSLRWIVLGYLVNAWGGVGGVAMTMAGLHKAYQAVVLISTGLSILANVVLLPQMGIEGAALSTFIGLVAFNVITVWLVHRKLGVWVVCRPRDILDLSTNASRAVATLVRRGRTR